MEEQLDRRLGINAGMKRAIIQDLQCLLHEHHALVRLFKSALEQMPNDDYKVVIKADKRPSGTHERTFNAPTVDEVAILIVGEETTKKQYCVDMYVKIETERLTFIRLNQAKLRSEEYIHLRDAVSTEGNAANIGRLTILPATYIGSPRHMHEYAQDAMTYVRHYGRPDLFITFTCNPKWIEITQLLLPGQTSNDRHDITARIFRQKIRSLMNFIVKQRVFGDTRCWMYSIEWQKRGLPHAHILIWLVERIQPDQIDDIICAEIPDHEVDPDLHDVVTTNMIHGPCGAINPQSPCMVDGKCSKRYPRKLTADTVTGNDGYPLYRRRSPDDNGRTVTTKVKRMDFVVDNSWIVPYSPLISKTFKTHCNVEYCNSVKSIKYICKYVTKGSDMAVFGLQSSNTNDEISRYQVGRYVNCNEAIWRIFAFPIHERHPTVIHLAVHLENGQRVYFTASNATQRAETPPATTLTSFFAICQSDQFARTLLYSEMPRYYTWNASSKNFQRRKQGDAVPGYPDVRSTDALGRMYTVHPKNDECFYLRLLLVNVRGPTSFETLRTVNGVIFPTYRAACEELNLLENVTHWDTTIAEAIISASPSQIRTLFAIIISTCFPSNPCNLWHKYKDSMSEDILHQSRLSSRNHDIEMNEEIHNRALLLIEDMCYLMCGNLLMRLGMPASNREMNDAFNRELERKREYDHQELDLVVQRNVPLLNYQQKEVYDTLMKAIADENGGLYFLDAPGGTGKTFLMSLVLATVRARSNIAVVVASSGIAATLLEGCRTAHSAFKLPLNLQTIEEPTCNIAKHSTMAKVLAASKIIIWDECTMAHKRALEALNRTLKDLRNDSRCFGGAMILLSGDFRQILPVIPRSTAADEINACLKSSNLWRYVKKLQLTTNLRVTLLNDTSAEDFSEQLLTIVICLSGVVAESDNEVKKGVFPFMGFIYYQDASILDESGERFRRGAVLIRTSWLISSSLDRRDSPLAFPQKTLLARLGTVNIDSNYNFNEDEEEQEREVIQIVQPYNFNSTQWWFYDVSLVKTLFPFNITSVIAPITPQYKRNIDAKMCKVLVYTRSNNNVSEDKILMQLSVELLSPSTDCGDHFHADTMVCGADSDDNKNFNYESDYCQGNSGGPLLCEGEVTGLQTYINDNCKQPHLFQHLPAWENFINCGIDARCFEKSCNTTCATINKDNPVNEIIITTTQEPKVMLVSHSEAEYSVTSTAASTTQETDKAPDETDTVPPTLTTITEEMTTVATVTENVVVNRLEEDRSTTWSDNKVKERPKSFDSAEDSDNMERKTNVEAQQQMIITKDLSSGSYFHEPRKLFLSVLTFVIIVAL
ncbi:uncharacterized protein [Battus philenor]|uniref:uncharacterized protein n=1 Tax=Battus philenor TaxID=42288 RepID=UPI0035CEC8B1